jgi:predicted aminopeptidase
MLLHAPRFKLLARLAALLLLAVPLGGCYLAHVAAGQLDLNSRRVPIAQLLDDPDLDPALRERLEYVAAVRHFSIEALGLPDNSSYTSYAELGRSHVVWNVFAAPEFSVEARNWCFPIAGCVSYRGYFREARAQDYAAGLARRGDDVHVTPVAAYSTLGHFEDPVLSSMLRYDDVTLAALLFHELAHQVVYVPGDSEFNEAFATVVEFEGTRRWLEAQGRAAELDTFLLTRERFFLVADLMVATRQQLEALYASGQPAAVLRQDKAGAIDGLRADYQRLRASWEGGPHMDALFEGEINNARLAAISTYHACVPPLRAELDALGGDLEAFYGLARRLAAAPAEERRQVACGI